MRRDTITGVLVETDALQWARLARGKAGMACDDSGTITLDETETTGATALSEPVSGAVSVAVASEDLLLRTLVLPAVDAEELAAMVSLQVDKISPFPLKDMVVAHEVVARRESDLIVLVAAARRSALDALGAVCREKGLTPTRLDAAMLAWWHLLRREGRLDAEGRACVLLRDGGGLNLMVFDDGVPVALRALGVDLSDPGSEAAAEIARELSYTLMSLELEHGGAPLRRVAIWWSGEPPEAVVSDVRDAAQCPVETHEIGELPSPAEGVAWRAAEGGDILDLTPDTWVRERDARHFRQSITRITLVLGGAWVVLVGLFFGGLAFETQRVRQLRARADTLDAPANEVRDMKRRVAMIRRYMDRSHSALECLREVSALLPAGGVELTAFSYRKGESVKISGQAASSEAVYRFKQALDGSDLFGASTLNGPIRNRAGRESFDLEMELPKEDAP